MAQDVQPGKTWDAICDRIVGLTPGCSVRVETTSGGSLEVERVSVVTWRYRVNQGEWVERREIQSLVDLLLFGQERGRRVASA